MKSSKFLGIFIILLLPLPAQGALLRDLKIGMRGADVKELQVFLNSDADTMVAPFGPGSSGEETEYFGKATQNAVIRFQEKYKTEVLAPAGLVKGSGYVGRLTRQKVQGMLRTQTSPRPLPPSATNPTPPLETPSTSPQGAPPAQAITPQYDFAAFVTNMRTIGAQQGMSTQELDTIETLVRVEAEKQEYGKNFIPELEKHQIKVSVGGPAGKMAETLGISDFFATALNPLHPKKAEALSGLPFGGRVLFPFLCTCSGNWLVTITPLPPTNAVLLTYYMGTQAYLNFTAPFTLNMVGEYTQGGQCMIYIALGCASIPNQGQITSKLGSS